MARSLSTLPSRSRLSLLPRSLSRWVSYRADLEETAFPSPSSQAQQQQQQRSHRLASVVDAVNERKLPPELRGRPNAIRSEADIENVVEQRVWRSMEEGQFDNLPGKGKPLNLYANPHADPAEDTLYRFLYRNGCAPEWVELNKEIRSMAKTWRLAMKKAWTNRSNSKRIEDRERLKRQLADINSKILHYNLIVPFGRQICGLKWEKEVDNLESE